VSPPKDEIESIWDSWGQMIEPFTANAPFMPGVGNVRAGSGTLLRMLHCSQGGVFG